MIDDGLLSGLPGGVRALLASPPLTDPRLLELAARWEGLPSVQAKVADALRLFVVTWDPLEWLAPRPEAVATANSWPLELVVYVPVWSLAGIARREHTTMAAVLAGLGSSAVTTAAAHEDAVTSGRYAELVAHRKAPDLLSGEPGPDPGEAAIVAVSPQWEDIGLGAITDFVQQAFAPLTSTGRWWSSPRRASPSPAALPARAAGSSSPLIWPILRTACAEPTRKRRMR